jgi:hypothetical protein
VIILDLLSNNIYIGDILKNLEKLNRLNVKVDCIFIDPVKAEDPTNQDNINKAVVRWKNSFYEKMEVAHKMLNESGIAFVCTTEDFLFDTLETMDSIFNKTNKIAIFTAKTNNHAKSFSFCKNTEFVLCYAKNKKYCKLSFDTKNEILKCTTSRLKQKIQRITLPKGTRVVDVADGIYSYGKQKNGLGELKLIGDHIEVKDGLLAEAITLEGPWSNVTDVEKWINKINNNEKHNLRLLEKENNKGLKKSKTNQDNEEKTSLIDKIYTKNRKEIKEVYLKGEKFIPYIEKVGFDNPSTFVEACNPSEGLDELAAIIGTKKVNKHKGHVYSKNIQFIQYFLDFAVPNKGKTYRYNCCFCVLDFYGGSGDTFEAVVRMNEKSTSKISSLMLTSNANQIYSDIASKRIANLKSGNWAQGKEEKIKINYEEHFLNYDEKETTLEFKHPLSDTKM